MSDIETMGDSSFENDQPETGAPEATPAPAAETTNNVSADQATPVNTGVPEYAPNFKFKVMDKEHEIPEHFRSIIKDADSEKMAREIFEKAYGLDFVKPKYESLKTDYEKLQGEYSPIKKDLGLLQQLLEKQDLGGFFSAFGLTDEQLIRHAMDRLEYHQLPPEKRQAMDQLQKQAYKSYSTEQELADLKAKQAQSELMQTAGELQMQLTSPHVQPIAESFNARAGQPDAFEKAIIAHAQNHYALHRQDLSVPQAIESFVRTFGLAASPQAAPQAAPASAQAFARPNTLPKVGSSTAAPVRSKVKSIDDIRKQYQQSMEN